MSHLLATDLEYTGLAEQSAITEIAIVHYNGEERLSEFVIKVHPENAPVALGALKVTRQSPLSIRTEALMPEFAAQALVEYFCNKVFPVVGNKKLKWLGHNVHGDVTRLKKLLERFGYTGWDEVFDYHLEDTAPMGSLLRNAGVLTMDKLSLGTLAEALEIESDKDKLHGALYDIDTTAKCYFKMIKLLRGLHGKSK